MQSIIDRITKLLALAKSPNENEAAQASAKAQELLMEHNLKLEDVTTKQKISNIPIEQDEIESNAKKVYWKGHLANAIAKSNFCKMWWAGSKIVVAGKTHNLAIAKSLYSYLTQTIERLATESVNAEKQTYQTYLDEIAGTPIAPFASPNWRTWKSSFITGATTRLSERLEEQMQRMNTEGIPNANVTGIACREAHTREQEAIAQWRREQGICLSRRRTGSKATMTRDGYAAGQRAGESINLNQQVNSSASSRLLR